MKKEFNLSKKRMSPEEFYEYQGGYKEEDIKEFIKRLKREVNLYEGKLTRGRFYDIINELAGDKLK